MSRKLISDSKIGSKVTGTSDESIKKRRRNHIGVNISAKEIEERN